MAGNLYYDMFSQFGDRLNAGIREGERRQAFSGGIPRTPDGAVDYQALAHIFLQTGDQASALAVTRLAEAQAENRGTAAYRQQQLGLQERQLGETTRQHRETIGLGRERLAAEERIAGRKPPDVVEIYDKDGNKRKAKWDPDAIDPEKGTPGTWVPIGGAQSPVKAMSATEMKAMFEAQDAEPALEATIRDLDRAAELTPKAFSGPGSQLRGKVGSWNLPLVNQAIDPDAAKATAELGQILSLESIVKMGATISGATTEKEQAEFQRILADPDMPPEIKLAAIKRMRTLAERQQQINSERVAQITGGAYRGRPLPGAAASPGVPGEVPPVPPPGPGAQIAPYTGPVANIGPGAEPPPGAMPPPPGGPTRSLPAQGGPPAPNAARQRIGATFGGPMGQSAPQPDVERIQRMGEAMEAAGMPPEIIAERLRQAFGIGGQRGTPGPAPPPGTPGVPGPLPSGPRPGMAGAPQGYGPVAAQSQVPMPPQFYGQALGQPPPPVQGMPVPGAPPPMPQAQVPPWLPQPPRPVPQSLPTGPIPPPQLLY